MNGARRFDLRTGTVIDIFERELLLRTGEAALSFLFSMEAGQKAGFWFG
jgi:hypothetical protein